MLLLHLAYSEEDLKFNAQCSKLHLHIALTACQQPREAFLRLHFEQLKTGIPHSTHFPMFPHPFVEDMHRQHLPTTRLGRMDRMPQHER